MMKFFPILACAICMVACKSNSGKSVDSQVPEISISGDSVLIPKGSNVGKKVRTTLITPESVLIPYVTTATVRALPECIAEVAVPFEGRIVESFVKSGQSVKEGSPLFSLHSPSFSETVKAFMQARQEKQVAELNLRRQEDLVQHGVGVSKELEDARLGFEIAKGQEDNLRATLSIYNVNTHNIEVGKPLVVTSPIQGEVVINNIRMGQFLAIDSDPMVCVADLRKVWVVAQVKENRIGFVKNQDEVSATIDAFPQKSFKGKVFYVGKILDEETRSLEVIIECDNSEQLLKPGMFATVTFMHEQRDGMILPMTSLVQGEQNTYVYKQIGQDRFVKTKVDVTNLAENKVIVLNGLIPGDIVITEGCIYLQ
jgi:membrane fusion protein, heavy metal efflux system